jgi:hypothetical protein
MQSCHKDRVYQELLNARLCFLSIFQPTASDGNHVDREFLEKIQKTPRGRHMLQCPLREVFDRFLSHQIYNPIHQIDRNRSFVIIADTALSQDPSKLSHALSIIKLFAVDRIKCNILNTLSYKDLGEHERKAAVQVAASIDDLLSQGYHLSKIVDVYLLQNNLDQAEQTASKIKDLYGRDKTLFKIMEAYIARGKRGAATRIVSDLLVWHIRDQAFRRLAEIHIT